MTLARRALVAAAITASALAVPLARMGATTQPGLPAEKLEVLRRTEQAQRDALAAPRAPKTEALPGISPPEPAWLTGIIESGQAPLPGSVYAVENQWHEVLGGEHVNAYAGAFRADPDQGVLVVETTALDVVGASAPGGVYPTPSAAGAVRIEEAAGAILVLRAESGARFVFDVLAREYV